MIASIVAIPLGIVCGLSESVYQAVNSIIQIFKPVSPLAWLPLLIMVVSADYISDEPKFEKSFLYSAFTLDKLMLIIQRKITWDKSAVLR